MSKLICPFCQQELHKDSDGYYTCYTDNCGCWANGGNGASGSESLWLTLIRTRKALDVAVDALKKSYDFYSKAFYDPELSEKWFVVCQVIIDDYVNKALEEIETALNQKD